MMFFQDTRSVGLIFWIVVGLLLFNGAIAIVNVFSEGFVNLPEDVVDTRTYCLLMGAGSFLCAAVYAMNAHRVMSKRLTKAEVLRGYVMTVGLSVLLDGIFEGLATYLCVEDPKIGMIIAVIATVVGLVIVLMSLTIASGRKGLLTKVVWFLLIVSFVLMAVDALIPVDTWWDFIDNVAHLLIAFFMIAFITDGEIRREMGVGS